MTLAPFAPVQALLQRYFDGLYHADTAGLRSVFHSRAIYASADESPLLFRTMEEYYPIVDARQAPSARSEVRHDEIDAIHFAGERTAFARVRCSIGLKDFVDFLTLVRVEEGWRIISKVFQITQRVDDSRSL